MLNLLKRIFNRNHSRTIPSQRPDTSTTADEAARHDEHYFRIGTTIGGRFEIHDLLGRGGFGIVYLAYCEETGLSYALKTFLDEFATDTDVRGRFDKEVSIWIALDKHPNIVQAHFANQIAGRLYLALEFVPPSDEGYNTLEGYIRSKQPHSLKNLQWAIQFCHGMEYAYSKGIKAHRDIKPDNIMLDRSGRLKITDFGLAGVLRGDSGSKAPVPNWTATAQGMGFGTPTHMPPEQFVDAASADERSDIYSFGVVLYQLETGGTLPFVPTQNDAAWQSLFEMHCTHSVPAIKSLLFPIIQLCLQKDPQNRIQSFKELRSQCESLLAQSFGREHLPPKPEAGTLTTDDLIAKGYSLDAVGRHEEAVECYEGILMSQYEPVVMNNMALALNHLGRHEEAIEWCDRALAISPDFSDILINKAVAFEGMGRFEESFQLYQTLTRESEPTYLAWYNAGNMLVEFGEHRQALHYYDEAIRLCPDYAPAYSNKGKTLDVLGKHEDAIRWFRKAVELNPTSFYAWSNMGVCLKALGDTSKAVQSFRKALDLNPRHVVTLTEMGEMLTEAGDIEGAMESYDAALEVNPKEVRVLAGKMMAFWKAGHIADAVTFGRMAVLISDDPQLHFFKGTIEDNAGQKKEAIESFSIFLKRNENDDTEHAQMARGRVQYLRAELRGAE
jgi:serine/threonine protein kinase/predicted Zn-dependent protease